MGGGLLRAAANRVRRGDAEGERRIYVGADRRFYLDADVYGGTSHVQRKALPWFTDVGRDFEGPLSCDQSVREGDAVALIGGAIQIVKMPS